MKRRGPASAVTARGKSLLESRPTENSPLVLRLWSELSRTARASEWWEFKLSPALATAYATALLLKTSIVSLWPQLLLLLVALTACATYVSVVNDLTDFKDDLASGKPNRLVGRSRVFVLAVLACCILPGGAVAIYWRDDLVLLSLYLASWVAFTLYSLPPSRLKGRGVFGLLADASGAHLFPTLLSVCLVYRWRGAPLDPVWLAAVAVWSLGCGLRGILWHELKDIDNDEKIGLGTFVRRHKIARVRWLGNFVVFPAELCALALMLWRMDSLAALALLCVYALLELSRAKLLGVSLVAVVPKPRARILMQEYYEALFPLAVVLASSGRYHADALMIVVHLALFPRRAAKTLKDGVKLIGRMAQALLDARAASR